MTDPPMPTVTSPALVDQRLTPSAFHALAGHLGGHAFVKVVVERASRRVHFLNEHRYRFHSDYVGEQILGVPGERIDADIDRFNESVYRSPERRFYVATLTLHAPTSASPEDKPFYALETVEIDTMDVAMILDLLEAVARYVDPAIPLVFKPASHLQERAVAQVSPQVLPRVLTHELFSAATFLPLNPGRTKGRLRAFGSTAAYREGRSSLAWFDILVMPRVPDDVPRVAGLVNAERTTPLAHPNVLAHGWGIPNAIQIGVLERIDAEKLDGAWVEYAVGPDATAIELSSCEAPADLGEPPWMRHAVQVDAPETTLGTILPLDALRARDRDRFGTKAANLGELEHVLAHGSDRLIGFYRIARPPRESLLPHLAHRLGCREEATATELQAAAEAFLRAEAHTLRGVALPFALSSAFFRSSPAIQQGIGRLKMLLELDAPQSEAAALELARAIRAAPLPDAIRDPIEAAVAGSLAGVRSLVVRSSSNAEDLEGFSAAGVYESVTHVTSRERLLESIKTVWASLFSPRAVRLRADVGIRLEEACMGVVVQEELAHSGGMGGVLVTANPTASHDFRDVYLNVSLRSVGDVVADVGSPLQVLCNTVEGGSQTLSLGGASGELDGTRVEALERLALVGRLLQSHFAPDETFARPLDIEWLWMDGRTYLLQVRPYAG